MRNPSRLVTCNVVIIALVIISTIAIIWGTGSSSLTNESSARGLDAIIVLGGGLTKEGGIPLWVSRRLDHAFELQSGQPRRPPFIVVSSGGSGAVPPVLTAEKFVIHEATVGTNYLHDKWNVDFSLLLKEWSSYDTVGNAFFTLITFAKPLGWRRIAVVTSDFHMPRSRALFEWVYGLQGAGHCSSAESSKRESRTQGYVLEYHSVTDQGLDETALKGRLAVEENLLKKVKEQAPRIRSMQEFHNFFIFRGKLLQHVKAAPDWNTYSE